MNKIEIAISDTKLRVEGLEQNRIILTANIDLLKEQLYALEKIKSDKSIPHCNPQIVVDNESILKARWETWDIVKRNELDEYDIDSAYTDGFTKGALWMQDIEKL